MTKLKAAANMKAWDNLMNEIRDAQTFGELARHEMGRDRAEQFPQAAHFWAVKAARHGRNALFILQVKVNCRA